MPIRSLSYGCSAILVLSAFFAGPALGQAPSSSSSSMEQEIEYLRGENAAVREQLSKLIDEVNKLQRRLDGQPAPLVRESPPPPPSSPTQPLTASPHTAPSSSGASPASGPAQTTSGQAGATNVALNAPPPSELPTTPVQPEFVPAPQT